MQTRASLYTEEARCDVPGALTLFGSVQAIPSGKMWNMCPVQRHILPLPPILCFPEPSSSYKILSCGVIALLTADNVSHFIIHTGEGVYKSCLQGQSGTSESWLEGLLPPCHVLILRTCSNSSVFITASTGSY